MNADKVKDVVLKAKDVITEKSETSMSKVSVEDILFKSMKLPMVKINRERFLEKELKGKCTDKELQIALEHNPAYAGISIHTIDEIAKQIIKYETDKVSAISFAAGLPGGWAMAGTIPADITQYFGFIFRVMQQLAYLYGFEQFNLDENDVNGETMDKVLIFLGIMFGVQGANVGVRIIAGSATKKASKSLAQKALTKGTIYPIVKKIAKAVGVRMTKQIFANGVSKIVPVIGGIFTGGLTYFSFKPCAKKLQKSFQSLNICNPEYYKNPDNFPDDTISGIDYIEYERIEG